MAILAVLTWDFIDKVTVFLAACNSSRLASALQLLDCNLKEGFDTLLSITL